MRLLKFGIECNFVLFCILYPMLCKLLRCVACVINARVRPQGPGKRGKLYLAKWQKRQGGDILYVLIAVTWCKYVYVRMHVHMYSKYIFA